MIERNYKKGFTLIELLAVIIVLALILVFAIPAVLDTSTRAQKKTFATYARRVLTLAQEYIEAERLDAGAVSQTSFTNVAGSGFSLGTNDTEYDVCIVYDPDKTGDEKYTIYMRNDSYYVDDVNDTDLKSSNTAVTAINTDHSRATKNLVATEDQRGNHICEYQNKN